MVPALMADHARLTFLYRELVGLFVSEATGKSWKPTVRARSLAEAFRKPPWSGDLSNPLKKPIAITIRNEVKFDPSGALRDAKAAAAAATVGDEFVPYFSISRRKADAGISVGDSLVVTDLNCLVELLKGHRIE